MKTAAGYAMANGQTTLGMTRVGQNLVKLIESRNIPWSEVRSMWSRLSSNIIYHL